MLNGRPATRLLLVAALAVGSVAALPACTSSALHGRSRLQADYTGRDLATTLPAEVTVAQAAAAAESALVSGGYAVTERAVAADRARLVGAAPDRSGFWPNRRPVVTIEPLADGVRTTVTLQPFGDEEASRRILDEMLGMLGL